MGTDIQRILLWILFGLSAFMLWDRWEVYTGHPGIFGGGEEQQAAPQTSAPADTSVPTATVDNKAVPDTLTESAPTANLITVETDLARISFDPEGAVITKLELTQEKQDPDWTETGLVGLVLGKKPETLKDVVLFDQSATRTYLAQTGLIGGDFPTHKTPFKVADGPLKLADGQDKLTVSFEGETGGVKLVKTFTFTRNDYAINVEHKIVNNSAATIKPSVYYQITRDGDKPEGQSTMINAYTGAAVYSANDKFRKVSFSNIKDDDKNYDVRTDNGWIGMIQHYFVSAWIPTEGLERENYTRTLKENLYAVGTIVNIQDIPAGESSSTNAVLYSGPQDQKRLDELAPGLSLVVDYGWLTFLAEPIYWLVSFLHSLVRNWGWAIVLLTCIVKAILYPLSLAGYRSMAKMKDLSPRLAALKEKYGDDKQQLNMAMMELYKTEKINPVGGCLPILLQLPVFLALYWVLLGSVELRGAPWLLWIHDLAAPDPWFILPIIMIFTMWIQYKLNPTPPDPIQAKVMAIMPFAFGIMFMLFPSGLVLYWLVNNILSIIQQYAVNKQIARDRIKRQTN